MILPIQVTLLPNYILLKTKTFKQLESFDNPCNIFTFWNCMAYFRFPGNPRFYTWCRKNGWRKSATNDSLHYSSKFKTCRYHIIYISIYRKLEYGWTAYPFSRKRNRLSPFCFSRITQSKCCWNSIRLWSTMFTSSDIFLFILQYRIDGWTKRYFMELIKWWKRKPGMPDVWSWFL